jgi:pyruvate kinase
MSTDRLVERTLTALRTLRARALEFEATHTTEIEAVEPRFRNSARNLLQYLSIRQSDIRGLQQDLHSLGLSSLGILESHTMASLNAVIGNLEILAGADPDPLPPPPADFLTGPLLLHDHARRLLGPTPRHRAVRIMVTMPSDAASDVRLVEDLLHAGMDIMRINCAHDDPDAWRKMAANLRHAQRVVGRECRIQADLGGPKLRTGSVMPAGHFLHIKPLRSALRQVLSPARVRLLEGELPASPKPDGDLLPLTGIEFRLLQPGDTLRVADLRGRERDLQVVTIEHGIAIGELRQTLYVAAGAECAVLRDGVVILTGEVGALPAVDVPIPLQAGDTLVLTRDTAPGKPARLDAEGKVVEPAHIHCTLPAVFERVRVGHRVWLDDGKIGGVVRASNGEQLHCQIQHAPPGGAKLRAEKGINFPDTELDIEALTPKDLQDLREVVGFADIVALSFVRTPEDVVALEDQLHALGAGHLGIVLKIENATAFRNLPRILLTSLRSPPAGVMVARGDLAVEVGFERLSEVQEEILWLCEAAHVPVIWATQVLEGLAKAGAPTRAEVSDAVMSSRAECVMLNKGPRVVETVQFLVDILERMSEHHDKRMALLRRLSVSEL